MRKMILKEDSINLGEQLKEFKSELGVTYKKLNDLLGRPCTSRTLQHRVQYSKKLCSQKLHDAIISGIQNYRNVHKSITIDALKEKKVSELTVAELIDIFENILAKKSSHE